MRSTELVVVTSRDRVLLFGKGGLLVDHDTVHAAQWSGMMQALANPLAGDAVDGIAINLPQRDIDVLEGLVADGFILETSESGRLVALRDRAFSENKGFHLVPAAPVCQHLIVACAGSVVAGLMAPTLLSLCYSGFQQRLDVVLTAAAQKFLTRDLLESYGIRTWVDAFERRDDIYVPHVHLGRAADCVLVMPASANSLHRLAVGACTDLLSMIIAATHSPVVLAPVMNDAMWNDRAIQRNVQVLREDGMYVIEPTIIFGAADLASQSQPMYGGHGTLWSGPFSLMQALSQILRSHGTRVARGQTTDY
jgi:hypothetical protein